jgi:glycosyltransferase involved in cell wall biosynthesis
MTANISVVIPTHNRLECLYGALRSVFNQTLLPAEVVVIDDGSSPNVPAEIFTGAPRGIRTLLIRNDTPKGAPNARNKGIEAASGEWIAFLDDDDEYVGNKIAVVAEYVGIHSDCQLIYHRAAIEVVNEGVKYVSGNEDITTAGNAFRKMLTKNRIGGTSMVVARRDFLVEVGKFDEGLKSLQDYELWLRCLKNGCRIGFLDVPLTCYYYRTNKASISKSLATNRASVKQIEAKYGEQYESLDKSERREYESWKYSMLVHKALLSYEVLTAFRLQLRFFMASPSPKSLVSALLIPFGPKVVFRLKAMLG